MCKPCTSRAPWAFGCLLNETFMACSHGEYGLWVEERGSGDQGELLENCCYMSGEWYLGTNWSWIAGCKGNQEWNRKPKSKGLLKCKVLDQAKELLDADFLSGEGGKTGHSMQRFLLGRGRATECWIFTDSEFRLIGLPLLYRNHVSKVWNEGPGQFPSH